MSSKVKSRKRVHDSDEEEPSSSKRAKPVSTEPVKDKDGNDVWELSSRRRVGISEYSKKLFVNIREYYEKDGDMLPGKKGISLSVEQYAALINVLPQLEKALADKGESVPRPDYSGQPVPQDDDSGADEDEDEDVKPAKKDTTNGNRASKLDRFKMKKNHESTSDED